jgi:hypothetical protein
MLTIGASTVSRMITCQSGRSSRWRNFTAPSCKESLVIRLFAWVLAGFWHTHWWDQSFALKPITRSWDCLPRSASACSCKFRPLTGSALTRHSTSWWCSQPLTAHISAAPWRSTSQSGGIKPQSSSMTMDTLYQRCTTMINKFKCPRVTLNSMQPGSERTSLNHL